MSLVRRRLMGANLDESPYNIITGVFVPEADSASFTLEIGNITPVLLEGHAVNYSQYVSAENVNALIGFYIPYGNSIIPTSFNGSKAYFFVYNSGSEIRPAYNTPAVSIQNGVITVKSGNASRIFKAGIPIEYVFVGI